MRHDTPCFYVYVSSGATFEFLEASLQPYKERGIAIKQITHRQITDERLLEQDDEKILSVFFPGARSGQAYHDDLGPAGIAQVRDYVARGGSYHGICAGAYMACRHISYRGHTTAKETRSKWDFFHGTATGQLPLLEPSAGVPPGWMTANVTSVTFGAGGERQQAGLLYWGGPHLLPAPDEHLTVLATYDALAGNDGTPAIAMAAKDFGRGRVVFHGVHSEIGGAQLYSSPTAAMFDHDGGKFRHRLAVELYRDEKKRLTLFDLAIGESLRNGYGTLHKGLALPHNPANR